MQTIITERNGIYRVAHGNDSTTFSSQSDLEEYVSEYTEITKRPVVNKTNKTLFINDKAISGVNQR